jgi:hypothetical protein
MYDPREQQPHPARPASLFSFRFARPRHFATFAHMTETPAQTGRSPLPWILLAFWAAWLLTMAWMARGEFTKERPKHERERLAPDQRSDRL